MRLLVKIGGSLLDSGEQRRRLAREAAEACRSGHQLVLVHGGGKQMNRFLAQRGIQSQFIDGLRVTTPDTIDAVLKVFAGSVNHELVAALIAAGAPAVGLTGIDAGLVEAEPLRSELGAVGKPVRCDPKLLDLLVRENFLPVVACVAGDGKGAIFNVNADQMAVSCAIGFRAERLIFLTDVDGVLDAGNRLLPTLTAAECEELIRTGTATGGMLAKLTAAGDALRSGVGGVVIAAGAQNRVISRLLGGERLGTRLITTRGLA